MKLAICLKRTSTLAISKSGEFTLSACPAKRLPLQDALNMQGLLATTGPAKGNRIIRFYL